MISFVQRPPKLLGLVIAHSKMALPKRRRNQPNKTKPWLAYNKNDHRPKSPDDPYIKYAIDQPTQKELRWKNFLVTFISMAYIFIGGGIFVWLEVKLCKLFLVNDLAF